MSEKIVDNLSSTDRPRIGLALSGGAARGIAHIGVLRALEENAIPIDAIAGASAGALIGAHAGSQPLGQEAEPRDRGPSFRSWSAPRGWCGVR